MFATLAFWLALAIPGYVVVRLVDDSETASGLLGTLGVSYVATFVILSPISIACYLLHLPVAVLTVTVVLLVLAALIMISHRGWWRDVGKLAMTGLAVEFAVILLDMWVGGRIGATTNGDAFVHIARIRFILHNGISNLDPSVQGSHFFPLYHTNILHALYAACAQITQRDPIEVWYFSLPIGKLLIAAGSYYLAWCIFERRWMAWLAAMFVVAVRGPVPFVIYPNQLSHQWLLPIAIAFAVKACQSPCEWKQCAKLGGIVLVMGQVHGLYAGFAFVVLAPVIATVSVYSLIKRWKEGWRQLACAAVLGIGVLFPLVSAIESPAFHPDITRKGAFKTGSQWTDTSKAFYQFNDEWTVNKWRSRFGAASLLGVPCYRYWLLGACVVAALFSSRRKQAGVLVGAMAIVLFILHCPPVCTFALSVVGKGWILLRLYSFFSVGLYVLFPGAILFLVDRRLDRWRWVKPIVSLAFLVFVFPHVSGHKAPYDWDTARADALKSKQERREGLKSQLTYHRFLRDNVEAGATVLTSAGYGWILTAHRDCSVVFVTQASTGVEDRRERREDLSAMMSPATPWRVRSKLLNKYGVEYFVSMRPTVRWTKGHVERSWKINQRQRLYLLNVD